MDRPVKLGWVKDPPSDKDRDAHHTLKLAPPPPKTGTIRPNVVSILNQGNLGSCTANSAGQNIRINQKSQGAANPSLISRLMTYYLARAQQGPSAIAADDGTFLRSIFDSINRFGFCPEEAWPYDVSKFAVMPSSEAFREAFDQKDKGVAITYEKIMSIGSQRIDDIKRAISSGFAVSFGTLVTEAFCNGELPYGPIPKPNDDDPIAGGHALVFGEYDESSIGVINSWGEDWGNKGWCRFSYEYVMWSETNDLWIVRKAPLYSDATS